MGLQPVGLQISCWICVHISSGIEVSHPEEHFKLQLTTDDTSQLCHKKQLIICLEQIMLLCWNPLQGGGIRRRPPCSLSAAVLKQMGLYIWMK